MSPSRLFRYLAPVVFLACTEGADPTLAPSDPGAPPIQPLILDAVHGGGNEHFFWLPPMVGDPGSFNGAFDGSLSPVVRICDLADCASQIVAEYSMTAGPGSETVRVDPAAEHYIVNWHTDQFPVGPGPTYRIAVLVAGTQLALADVALGATGKDAKNLTTNETIGLKDGRTLPIKFRIEEQAVLVVGEAGGTFVGADGRVTLMVPPGAVPSGQAIGITISPVSDLPPGVGLLPGTVFDFQPDGTVFLLPVQLTVVYDEPNVPAGLAELDLTLMSEEGGVWDEVAVSSVNPAGNTISGEISGFSKKGGGAAAAIEVSPETATILTGETTQLSAAVTNKAGDPITRPVKWTSDDDAVATVDNAGLVTSVAPGVVMIRGSSGKAEDSAEITVENNPPAVEIATASGQFDEDEQIQFDGTGTDLEDGTLSGASLVWTSSLDGQIGTGASFLTLLSPGTHVVTLTATDSKGAAATAEVSIQVRNVAPTVQITAPADNSEFAPGDEIPFTGTASDPGQGPLTGSFLVWSSDLDGLLGTGELITTSALSAGTHIISLTVDDQEGAVTVETITVVVTVRPGFLRVGDIIASMLDEQRFQARYGSDWVPADRRNVSGSAYAQLKGVSNAPDLRGYFLRGEDAGRNDGFALDQSGIYDAWGGLRHQYAAIQIHTHSFNIQPYGNNYVGGGAAPGWRPSSFNPSPLPGNDMKVESTGPGIGLETRPNNVAVAFYVRIGNSSTDLALHEVGVGDIVTSMLDETAFQNQHGSEWVLADGRSAAGSDFATLTGFANVPDLRGMFLRGAGDGRFSSATWRAGDGAVMPDGSAVPPGAFRPIGSIQFDAVEPHSHTLSPMPKGDNYVGGGAAPGWRPSSYNPSPLPQNDLEVLATGGTETRPNNAAVYYYIRLNEGSSGDGTPDQVGIGDIVTSVFPESEFQSQHGGGWVLADGRSVAGTPYQTLTGSATVPDLRAMFLRGISGSRADGFEDPDGSRTAGSVQGHLLGSHTHDLSIGVLGNNYVGGGAAPGWRPASFNPFPLPENDLQILSYGALETRPSSILVYFYVRVGGE